MRQKRTAGMVLRDIGDRIVARWRALDWYWRFVVVVLLGAAAAFLVLQSWLAAFGMAFYAFVVADWQYWRERGQRGQAFTDIGIAVAKTTWQVIEDDQPRSAGVMWTDDGREYEAIVGPRINDEDKEQSR